jgi:hypothetical protein
MKQFERLGALLHERWLATNFDEFAFPDLAAAALAELPPIDYVASDDVIRWALSSNLGVQTDPFAKFGEPPITVLFTPRFYIEVLYWLDGTTQIHQHSFSGAFYVLDGSSIHSCYEFTPEDRVNSNLQLGQLRLKELEILHRGQLRTIRPRSKLIHALFHLEQPSVSIVIRTPGEQENLPQLSYDRPHLAYSPTVQPTTTLKLLQVLELAIKIRPDWPALAMSVLKSSDFETGVRVLNLVQSLGKGLDALQPLFESMRSRHGDRVRYLPPVFEEKVRQRKIIAKRATITRAEHRFFLALLLNVSSRRGILDLVARRFPERPAIETVMTWITELARPVEGATENLLGIPLNETSLSVLHALIEGKHGQSLRDHMIDDGFDAAEIDAAASGLSDLEQAFRTSMFFRPLISD